MEKNKVSVSPEEILAYQVQKQIRFLFKEYLLILERICSDNAESLQKLSDNLPEQYKPYVILANHLTEDKYSNIRKEILDRGNDAMRATADEIKKYKIEFYN